jgi:hypothetical protein
MTDLQITRRHVLRGVGAVSVAGVLSVPSVALGDDEREGSKFRWDIITTDAALTPGGEASAKASDGSMITMTGSGTFVPGAPDAVTGGGRWRTNAATGASTGSGTYRVRSLVSFAEAPGALPPDTPDRIGKASDARAGLAVFRIAYSNGSHGVLVFSCMLPGSPESVLEGITATMGFTDFWNSVIAPLTIFHVVHQRERD